MIDPLPSVSRVSADAGGVPISGSYERACADEGFLERFRAAYRGQHASLDALWWLEHPGETAPSGAEAPEAALVPLHEAVFGRDGAARSDAESEVERILESIREQRELALAALVAADVDTEEDSPLGAEDRAETAPDDQDRRRRTWILVGAAAVVLAAAAGFVGGAFAGSGGTSDASSPPAVDLSGVLAVFERPQIPATDLPTLLDSSLIRPDTLRGLGMAGPAGLYAARDFDGNVCLLLVQPTGGYTSNCVAENEFPATGLPLRGTYLLPGTVDASDSGSLSGTNTEIDVLWTPDGALSGSSTTPVAGHDFGRGEEPLPTMLFEVFDRPQEERDRIPADTAGAPVGALNQDTERYLATDDGRDLFAARLVGAGGDVCLLLVDEGEAISACGPPPVSLSAERGPEYALSAVAPGTGWDALADGLWVRR